MNGLNLEDCQGKGGQYNLVLGTGVKACTIDNFHNEGPTVLGVLVAWGASGIAFTGMYSSVAANATTDYMSLGQNTGTDADDFCRNVSVKNSVFTGIKRVGINVYTSASAYSREISYCSFDGAAGTETGIELENASQHGLTVGPNKYGTLAVEVSNTSKIDILRIGDTLGLVTYNSPVTMTNTLNVTGRSQVAGLAHTQVNVASATDIAWIDTSNVWRITGTTTINTIAAPTAGNPVLHLIFVSNPTVNDESTAAGNLALATNTNFASTADDTLSLVWNSTLSKWHQIGSSVN